MTNLKNLVALFKSLNSYAAFLLVVTIAFASCTTEHGGMSSEKVINGIDWSSTITTPIDKKDDVKKDEKFDIYCTENGERDMDSYRKLILSGRANVSTSAPELTHFSTLPAATPVSKDKGSDVQGEYPKTSSNWEDLTFMNGKVEFNLNWSKQSELVEMCTKSKTFESGFTAYKVLPRNIEPTGKEVIYNDSIREIYSYVQPFEFTHTASGHNVTLYGDSVFFTLPKGAYNPEKPRVTEIKLRDRRQICETKAWEFDLTFIYSDGSQKDTTDVAKLADWGIFLNNVSDVITTTASLTNGQLVATGTVSQYKANATERNFSYAYQKQPLTGSFSEAANLVTGYDWYTSITYTKDDAVLTLVNEVPTRTLSATVSQTANLVNGYNEYASKVYASSKFVNCESSKESNSFKVKVKKEEDKVEYKKENYRTDNASTITGGFDLDLAYDYNKYVNGKLESTEIKKGKGTLMITVPGVQTKEVNDFAEFVKNNPNAGSWSNNTRTWTVQTSLMNFAYTLTLTIGNDFEGEAFKVSTSDILLADASNYTLVNEANEAGYEAVKSFVPSLKVTVYSKNGEASINSSFPTKGILKKKQAEPKPVEFDTFSAFSIVRLKDGQFVRVAVAAANGKAALWTAAVGSNDWTFVKTAAIDASGVVSISANNFLGDMAFSGISSNANSWLWTSCEVGNNLGSATGSATKYIYQTNGFYIDGQIYQTATFSKNADGTYKMSGNDAKGACVVNNIAADLFN